MVSNCYPVFAVNREAKLALLGKTLVPITNWMNETGEDVPPDVATVFVCGTKRYGFAAAAFQTFTSKPH